VLLGRAEVLPVERAMDPSFDFDNAVHSIEIKCSVSLNPGFFLHRLPPTVCFLDGDRTGIAA
jgi:hypothetical protein